MPLFPSVPIVGSKPNSSGYSRESLIATKNLETIAATANPMAFNGVKVFSATMFARRDRLGEDVTDWINRHPQFEIADLVVTQSSDASFHCIAISVFYFEPPDEPRR